MPSPGKMNKTKRKPDEEEWVLAGAHGVAAGPAGGDSLMSVWQSREICITCKLRVNSGEKGITCDMCKRWYHKECENVNKKDYEFLTRGEGSVKWFCRGCESKIEDMSKGYRKLEKKLEDMEVEMVKLRKEEDKRQDTIKKIEEQNKKMQEDNERCWEMMKGEIEKIDKQIRELVRKETKSAQEETQKKVEATREEIGKKQEKKLQGLREEIEKMKKMKMTVEESDQSKRERKQEMELLKKEVISEGMQEIRKTGEEKEKKVIEMSLKIDEIEKERKKKNIVIFNVEESEEKETGKRIQEDMDKCLKIFAQELEVQDLTVEKVIRIGRKSEENKRRPMIVKLGSENDRNTVLGRAKKLRYSEEFVRVYIVKDLTEDEREKDKKLRKELKEKREKEEGQFIIRRGKVIEVQQGARRRESQPAQDF